MAAMATIFLSALGERGDETEGEVGNEGDMGELGYYSSTPEDAGAYGSGAQQWWGCPACMEDASPFCRARGVQRSGRRGMRFGPFPGRIGPWAKYEVCLSRRTLQLSLRVLSHYTTPQPLICN